MTSTPKALTTPFLVSTSLQTAYTTPTSTTAIIKYATVHNTASTPVEVTIYRVENGGTAGSSNQRFKKLIAPEDDVPVFSLLNATLEAGSRIQVIADTASSVSLDLGGIEVV